MRTGVTHLARPWIGAIALALVLGTAAAPAWAGAAADTPKYGGTFVVAIAN